ncbi:hypothetical protein SLEP1_g18890 [Rubroshorea leprosula]|uniref:CARD domain-containing protein n=1 Tax=Rubroshorea leprosula TaxID=152421 RepID=A0AAV5J4J7_9ROSI|nr:hypothetical protein SLEP1_g18890 [Rubroshorea leprosula]
MESILAPSPLTVSFISPFSPAHQNCTLPHFNIKFRLRTHKFPTRKSYRILPITNSFRAFRFQRSSTTLEEEERARELQVISEQGKNSSISTGYSPIECIVKHAVYSPIECIAKHAVYTLFFIAVGLCNVFPVGSSRVAAIAAPVTSEVTVIRKGKVKGNLKEKEEILKKNDYEYSHCTRRLLETVSQLLRSIEGVRRGNGDAEEVKLELKRVKLRKEELQEEIMDGLYSGLNELRMQKEILMARSEEIVDEVVKMRREGEKLSFDQGAKNRMELLEESMGSMEEEYNETWERLGDIEDEILRRETIALSIGVRELCFIERECEELVQSFQREMRRKEPTQSLPKGSITKLSKSEIQNHLEVAQRRHFEETILPSLVQAEDLGPLFHQDSLDFALRIKQCLEDSRERQRNLEAQIRKSMKKFGNEKCFVAKTPEDEVVKGFPEFEVKWMFGEKELVVPKATSLYLYNGWKKWRAETKAELKRKLLEDVDFGKQYVARKQEHILLDRDRVITNTWYNEEKHRWEMDPVAVPYAVSKKLVENARIRHDWAVMYIALKGDDKEYYVDIKEFEMLFENFGGFDGLYMKMLACGTPTAVQLMWIPFSELNFSQQFVLMIRLACQCLNGLWKTRTVSYWGDWICRKIKNINDDIMMMIGFPLIEFIIPYPVRLQFGVVGPSEIGRSFSTSWYLKWRYEIEMEFESRKTDGILWFLWFLIRSTIYGFVLFNVFQLIRTKIPKLLGYGPLLRDPKVQKWRRLKAYLKYKVKKGRRMKLAGVDPITTAFDRMKRVKKPPIPLKDFASIESMREEINEVVAFLQNPSAFQEMGARAPRGVLIVGERGTGKTSLALAIAAESKVPVVRVKAQQLEAGKWIGQGASNIRELFQTARDLAPVIIFVEDFDLFAGVRGKFIHTEKHDHEAFINQLLVELDGFEKQDGVVLMATTRNIKQIDQALRRPGRMDRIFHLQRPTQIEREKILHIAAKETMDEELTDLVDWKKVAEKTTLLRPIELKLVPVALESSAFRSKLLDTDELMSYCSWFATFSNIIPNWVRKTKIAKKISKLLVNHLGLTLTKEDLQNVVDVMEPYGQISNGIELLNPPLEWTRETKFPHAVWAAGRGLIALLLPNFDVVDDLWLEPCSWEGIGCTKITRSKYEGLKYGNAKSRSYLEKKLVFCFGSHIAAQLLLPFGEENFLSASELKQAQEIATRMVIQYGWGPDDSTAIYYRSNATTALSMGNNYEFEMATKVEKIYDLAYERAKDMLQKNLQVLEKIVEELLEFEILTGKDLERILQENGGIAEKEPFFLLKVEPGEPLSSSFLDGGNASGTAFLSSAP